AGVERSLQEFPESPPLRRGESRIYLSAGEEAATQREGDGSRSRRSEAWPSDPDSNRALLVRPEPGREDSGSSSPSILGRRSGESTGVHTSGSVRFSAFGSAREESPETHRALLQDSREGSGRSHKEGRRRSQRRRRSTRRRHEGA